MCIGGLLERRVIAAKQMYSMSEREAARRMHVERMISRSRVAFVFFFQAEDGIRDLTVTGVQTCALPILCRRNRTRRIGIQIKKPPRRTRRTLKNVKWRIRTKSSKKTTRSSKIRESLRSEERRVGKEGRSRGRRDH